MHRVRVGLVSDTHGLFEPRLRRLFAGCDRILHGGDVVEPEILRELARIAPVEAVRGNNDLDPAFDALPELLALDLGVARVLVIHSLGSPARPDPAVREALARHRAAIVVHGHSHRPGASVEGGVLFVNPGSAGPRRFRLPRSAGTLLLGPGRAEVRLFDLASERLAELAPPVVASLGAGAANA
jgi:putative phosphoesterase